MNPTVGSFRTQDGRFITLMLLQPKKYFADLCKHLGLDHLPDDERLQSDEGFVTHADEVGREVAAAFAAQPFAYWVEQLQTLEGPWAPGEESDRARRRRTARGQRMLPSRRRRRRHRPASSSPTRCSSTKRPPTVTRGPLFAEHTEDILRELGQTDADIGRLRAEGACT